MSLYFIVTTENCCSNIESVIPSKYIGELSYKVTGFLRRDLFFKPSANTKSKFSCATAKSIIRSFNRFEYFSNKKYKSQIKYIYIYKALKDYDLSAIHLSIDNPKIFTYSDADSKIIKLIDEYSQSYYEVIDHIKNMEYHQNEINPNHERINFYLNEITQELMGQKQNFPKKLKSMEYSDLIDKIIINPQTLKRSKKLIKIYKNWFDSYIKLRFN